MKNTTAKTRREFDEAFKRDAVQNCLQSDKSAEVISEELGLQANQLYAWKKAFGLGAAGGKAADRTKVVLRRRQKADPVEAWLKGATGVARSKTTTARIMKLTRGE